MRPFGVCLTGLVLLFKPPLPVCLHQPFPPDPPPPSRPPPPTLPAIFLHAHPPPHGRPARRGEDHPGPGAGSLSPRAPAHPGRVDHGGARSFAGQRRAGRGADPVERMLWEIPKRTLEVGLDVILDFGFWSRVEQRITAPAPRPSAPAAWCICGHGPRGTAVRLVERATTRPKDTFDVSASRPARWSPPSSRRTRGNCVPAWLRDISAVRMPRRRPIAPRAC